MTSSGEIHLRRASAHGSGIAEALYHKKQMITDPKIERYIHGLLPARDSVLTQMEEYAEDHKIPIIGPAVGRFLATLVMISKARRIFELGSAIGYSTIWLARSAGQGAEVHYCDGSTENAEQAQAYFEQAVVADRIRVHVGDALTTLAQTPGEFDLIFNDVDKEGYPAVLKAVPWRIRHGGLFVTDNTLWHARILDPHDESDHAVRLFNEELFASPFFYTTQVPLRDGVSAAIFVRGLSASPQRFRGIRTHVTAIESREPSMPSPRTARTGYGLSKNLADRSPITAQRSRTVSERSAIRN
jgi:caffeoyl-CoA O-methyltransferase